MIYELAGLRVNIKNRCRYTSEFCKEYLSVDQLSPAAFEAEVTGEEFAEEKKQSEGFSDGYIENICLYRSVCLQMPKYGRFLLHSAVIEYENNAYAFLGRSGIGKSTHTALWINNVKGAEILNGDKPIIGFDESAADGEKFVAYGTPWNGKENRGKKGQAPLKALCFIERAKENTIEKIAVGEAADRIFTQILLPGEREAAEKTLELMDMFVRTVPAYVLHCNMETDAMKTSYKALVGREFTKNEQK